MNTNWGRYPWFLENGIDLIHPDDFEAFQDEANNCKVFECIEEGEYLKLRYNNRYYRVKPQLFRVVPKPKFDFGQEVNIHAKNKKAIITDIMWHLQKGEYYYFVSIDQHKNSKRFYESELS